MSGCAVTDVRSLGLQSYDSALITAGHPAVIESLAGKGPVTGWENRCHEISLAVLRTGLFGRGRVARGFHSLVRGQHSWIVLGDDCYDPDATLVDPTITACDGEIYVGLNGDDGHRPHGGGSCFDADMPSGHGGPVIALTPVTPLSPAAARFLCMLGPLDLRGWGEVAHMPVRDWPAAEIITAMLDTPGLGALIPVDIAGMVTDRNPGNLYW